MRAIHGRSELQVLQSGKVFFQGAMVAEKEQIATIVFSICYRLSTPPNLTVSRLRQTGQQAQETGFASTIFATHVQPLTRFDGQIEVRKQAAVTAVKPWALSMGEKWSPKGLQAAKSAKNGRFAQPRV